MNAKFWSVFPKVVYAGKIVYPEWLEAPVFVYVIWNLVEIFRLLYLVCMKNQCYYDRLTVKDGTSGFVKCSSCIVFKF